MELVGLVLNFIGGLLMAIASNVQTDIIFKHAKQNWNLPDWHTHGGMEENAQERNVQRVRKIERMNILTKIGYTLLLLGFALQIISYFCKS